MRERRLRIWAGLALALCGLAGCFGTRKAQHETAPADVHHYRDVATRIDYPDVHSDAVEQAAYSAEPRRIRSPRRDELWDMPLAEAIHIALANNPVVRTRGQFLRPGPVPLGDSATVYDAAIQESETLFGQQGVEAALSEFDAQLTTSLIWGRDERVQNNIFDVGLPPGGILQEDTAVFRQRLQKQMAYGGLFAINNHWDYLYQNAPTRLFPSAYTGIVEAEYRHPLLAGAGPDFTRIAGPVFGRDPFRATIGLDQGVVIARIRTDMTLAEFQTAVRNLLLDVETAYWDLFLAYRAYDAEVVARNSALEIWRRVEALGEDAAAHDEAQARDNYFEARARAENALADIYMLETQFRRLIGLPVNDCRVIRPCDEPVMAEFCPDWCLSLAEALTYRSELRRQKWSIKSLELQMQAARSLTRPRLDFVSQYRVNAFGDKLIDHHQGDDPVTGVPFRSAWHTLRRNDQTGWNLGLELAMPIGFRAAQAQVRNLELRVARARALLAQQELEISHELASAFQELDRWYATAQTNLSRRQAAEDRVRAFEVLLDAPVDPGPGVVDLLLRSQISLAQAEIAYFRSLVEYNKAIAEIHLRKETLLDYNSVHLAEGEWHPDAYRDALRRAWARAHAIDAEAVLHTRPPEFAVPGPAGGHAEPAPHLPAPAGFEEWLDLPGDVPDGEEWPPLGPEVEAALDGGSFDAAFRLIDPAGTRHAAWDEDEPVWIDDKSDGHAAPAGHDAPASSSVPAWRQASPAGDADMRASDAWQESAGD